MSQNDKSESGTPRWICTGCEKVVSSRPYGECSDCGSQYREATPEDVACDSCGNDSSLRLMDRTGNYSRLCPSCIDAGVADA